MQSDGFTALCVSCHWTTHLKGIELSIKRGGRLEMQHVKAHHSSASFTWQHTPVIALLRRQRQEDFESKDILSHIESSSPSRSTRDPISKNNNKKKCREKKVRGKTCTDFFFPKPRDFCPLIQKEFIEQPLRIKQYLTLAYQVTSGLAALFSSVAW